MYALDTNTLIDAFKGRGGVHERLLAIPPDEIGIPTVVLFELMTGLVKNPGANKQRAELHTLANMVHLLAFDAHAAQESAVLRATLEAEGARIGPYDTLIAGTALAHGAVLITRNTREFSRVPGLRCENWFSKDTP